MCIFEVFLTIFIVYFIIGLVFSGIILIIVPNEYKDQIHSSKAINVLTFLWPFLIISFFIGEMKKK